MKGRADSVSIETERIDRIASTPHIGAFFARDLEVQADAQIILPGTADQLGTVWSYRGIDPEATDSSVGFELGPSVISIIQR